MQSLPARTFPAGSEATATRWAAAACLLALASAAPAASAFEGRLANGTASSTCTVSGASKCTSFYDATLDITILNNWNIGQGYWSATAAPGSAQALAEAAGYAATGLTGWVLPTANADYLEGNLNQFRVIWYAAGGSPSAFPLQFDGVQVGAYYFSSSFVTGALNSQVWAFNSNGSFTSSSLNVLRFAVAVRPGDVAAVPEPQTWLLLLSGLGAVAVAWKGRRAAAAHDR